MADPAPEDLFGKLRALAGQARFSSMMAGSIVASRLLGRRRPLMVNIEATHRCNMRCVFCDKARLSGPELTVRQGLQLIDELAANGTLSVCFDGGEPLLHPAIGQLAQAAKARGMRVAMSTNGTLIPQRRDVLKAVDVVKISLDGPADLHDRGRQAGAHEQALDGARVAVELGVKVALRMTLARHNVGHHAAVLSEARKIGAVALFQPAIGSLLDLNTSPASSQCTATAAAYQVAMDELIRLKAAGDPVGNQMVCLEHLRSWPEPTPVPYCAGGRIEVAIGPDGGMYPCGRYGRCQPAPNVFELGVKEAFERIERPTQCRNCWCTLTLAVCFMNRLDPRLLPLRRPWLFSKGLIEAAARRRTLTSTGG